jgi:hypothetical protein
MGKYMEPRWVELWYKVPFVLVHSTRVARCATQPFSVHLLQIQQEERLGLIAKSTWVGAKGEYTVKSGVAVTGCWRDKERITCVKRVEVKKGIIIRRMVRVKCDKKAKGKCIWSGVKLMSSPYSLRSETISERFSWGR